MLFWKITIDHDRKRVETSLYIDFFSRRSRYIWIYDDIMMHVFHTYQVMSGTSKTEDLTKNIPLSLRPLSRCKTIVPHRRPTISRWCAYPFTKCHKSYTSSYRGFLFVPEPCSYSIGLWWRSVFRQREQNVQFQRTRYGTYYMHYMYTYYELW